MLIETDLTSYEVCLAVAPLFHIAGLNGLVLPGHPQRVEPWKFCPHLSQDRIEVIRERQVTCMFGGVPVMLDALSEEDDFTYDTLASL